MFFSPIIEIGKKNQSLARTFFPENFANSEILLSKWDL